MSSQRYFTAQEVVEKVEGLYSISTLNKWANFIQKECMYSFKYEHRLIDNNNLARRKMNHRKTRVFTLDEIDKLQQVANLIPEMGRDKALRQFFDENHQYDAMRHHELIATIIQLMDSKNAEYQKSIEQLKKECSNLNLCYQQQKSRIDQLEKSLEIDNTSSGWFRRKR